MAGCSCRQNKNSERLTEKVGGGRDKRRMLAKRLEVGDAGVAKLKTINEHYAEAGVKVRNEKQICRLEEEAPMGTSFGSSIWCYWQESKIEERKTYKQNIERISPPVLTFRHHDFNWISQGCAYSVEIQLSWLKRSCWGCPRNRLAVSRTAPSSQNHLHSPAIHSIIDILCLLIQS